jgi:hypothetical protein
LKKKIILILIFCFFFIGLVGAFSDNLPSIRYVTSKDGLNKRETASVTSKKLGTLLYGSRIIAAERSVNMVTIDGITDYWYRCHSEGWFWVFGGYLSATMPADVEPILGYWNTDRGERYYWYFRPDHTVSSGIKETDRGWTGTWALYGDKLTIKTTPTEYSIGESQTIDIVLTVTNRNRVFLSFADGNGEFLDRNNNLY